MQHEIIDEFYQFLILERGLSQNTVVAYASDLNKFQDYLRQKGIEDFTKVQTREIEGFIHWLTQKNYLQEAEHGC